MNIPNTYRLSRCESWKGTHNLTIEEVIFRAQGRNKTFSSGGSRRRRRRVRGAEDAEKRDAESVEYVTVMTN